MTDQTQAPVEGVENTGEDQTDNVVNAETGQPVEAQKNVTLTRDEFIKHARSYGRQYGQGMNSRPAMAMEAAQAASQLTDVSEKDAEEIYTVFQQAAAKAKGIEYKAESSFKVQVSKLKQFLTLGALPSVDGVAVLELTCDIIKELSALPENPLKGSAYDNMLKVTREQLKDPENPLSEQQIRGLLQPEEHEKTDLEKLIAQYKGVRKLTETIDSQNLQDALTSMGNAITDLGGEIPAEKAEAAAKRKVAALLRKSAVLKKELASLTGQVVEL